MQYPLELRFKVIALASQIYVTDNTGNDIFYVKQKLFKFKEAIEIYRSSNKDQLLYTLQADRIIDLSPQFTLRDGQSGEELGTIKRYGARSLFKASYDLSISGNLFAHLREANGWVKVADGLFGEIPIIGLFAGYLFHPKYIVEDMNSTQLTTLEKIPAFFEGKFLLHNQGLSKTSEQNQSIAAALLMTVALLERSRG
ncbi:MAG: hypothetical protein M3Q14_00670 [bacterium]|nr:hypothetical protein [bacterium]